MQKNRRLMLSSAAALAAALMLPRRGRAAPVAAAGIVPGLPGAPLAAVPQTWLQAEAPMRA